MILFKAGLLEINAQFKILSFSSLVAFGDDKIAGNGGSLGPPSAASNNTVSSQLTTSRSRSIDKNSSPQTTHFCRIQEDDNIDAIQATDQVSSSDEETRSHHRRKILSCTTDAELGDDEMNDSTTSKSIHTESLVARGDNSAHCYGSEHSFLKVNSVRSRWDEPGGDLRQRNRINLELY